MLFKNNGGDIYKLETYKKPQGRHDKISQYVSVYAEG